MPGTSAAVRLYSTDEHAEPDQSELLRLLSLQTGWRAQRTARRQVQTGVARINSSIVGPAARAGARSDAGRRSPIARRTGNRHTAANHNRRFISRDRILLLSRGPTRGSRAIPQTDSFPGIADDLRCIGHIHSSCAALEARFESHSALGQDPADRRTRVHRARVRTHPIYARFH